MKKSLVIALGLSCAMTTAAFAAPVTDFTKGNTLFDVGFINSELENSSQGDSLEWDSKSNLDLGVTHSLDNDFALQYKYQKSNHDFYGYKTKNDIQQFNIVHKINDHFNAIAGVTRMSGKVEGINDLEDKTKFQVGFTGHTAFNDKVSGWATLTAGSDVYSYEVGVGHKLADNTDLNLFYRYTKFSDMRYENAAVKNDIKVKGVGLGVTFKF